jgi:hypothetical protein
VIERVKVREEARKVEREEKANANAEVAGKAKAKGDVATRVDVRTRAAAHKNVIEGKKEEVAGKTVKAPGTVPVKK